MKKYIALILALVLAVSCFAACQNEPKEPDTEETKEGLSVGYAKADISPKLEWELGLVGGNNEKERIVTEIGEPLYATCSAITDAEGTTVLLFGTDLLHSATEVTMAVRKEITKELGIEGKYVQFVASHNHAGPGQVDGYGFENTDKYNEYFISQCVTAAKEAMEDSKPATMYCAFARPEGYNFKRYYVTNDGSYHGRNDEYTRDEVYGHTEMADNLLQVVKFAREGDTDVALVNWQAHYKGLSAQYKTVCHSDYAGVIRNVMEEKANCETVFLQGAGGDLNSSSDLTDECTLFNENLEYIGTALADAAINALKSAKPAETGKIHLEEEIFHIDTNTNDYYLYTFGFGDLGFVMAPYEMFSSLGMDIREDSPYKMTMIGTTANCSDTNFYMPNKAAYDIPKAYGVSEKYVKGDSDLFHEQYMKMLDICFKNSGSTEAEKPEGYITDHSPKCDGITYTNPNPGDKTKVVAVNNGLYQITLLKKNKEKIMLAVSKEVAEQMAEKTTMKLMLDERNVVTAIAE